MSNETDLDWLARNVHKWPCDPPFGTTLHWDGRKSGDANYISVYSEQNAGRKYTKRQWLARRAELQNKPSWKDAPEWAEWLAQDDDGEWKWLGSNPSKYISGWTANKLSCCKKMGSYGAVMEKGTILGDWRDTLEQRPEEFKPSIEEANRLAQEFKPFASIEDNQDLEGVNQKLNELEMLGKVSHLISDKRHRITPSKYTKAIRGVSVDVYDVLMAWGVSNPALQHLIKKALQCGHRGHKDNAQDLQDIIDSAIRAKELG